MKAYWNSLAAREKTLVITGLITILATVLYIAVLEPRYQRLNTLRLQVPARHQDLMWMQQQVSQFKSLLVNGRTSGNRQKLPLLTIIERTATQSGLRTSINRMQPSERGQVRVWFDDVYFDPWLRWLETLRKQKIEVFAASITRAGDQKVNIRVTLGQS